MSVENVACTKCRDTWIIPGSIPALDQHCDCKDPKPQAVRYVADALATLQAIADPQQNRGGPTHHLFEREAAALLAERADMLRILRTIVYRYRTNGRSLGDSITEAESLVRRAGG